MAKNLKDLIADIPALKPLALLVGLAVAVAAGITLYMWSRGPDYALLYSGLADKDAMEATDALQAAGIVYRLEAGGRGISVPRAQLDAARLKLAGQGIPRAGGMGAEMLREPPSLGTSPSLESARFQLALETELARTISSLRPVQGARVHLAMPKASAFTRDRRPASASVFVELYPGRTLDGEQIAAVVNMVASSVPDLDAKRVTVVDQQGRLLTQPDAGSELGASAAQLEYVRQIEDSLSQRVEDLLLPMTGAGRVRVKVNADINFAVTEEAREIYTPDPQKLRSEQTSEQTVRGGLPMGVPGAASNQPPQSGGSQAPAGVQASLDAATQSREATRNYELDKTVSHTRQPSGRLNRLTVAVLVDNLPQADDKGQVSLKPLDAEALKKLEALVREAVGADSARGDRINVMNAAFQRDGDAVLPEVPLWERPLMLDLARSALGVLLLIGLVLLVVRPALRSLLQAPPSPAPAPAAALADGRVLAEDVAALGASAGGAAALPAPSRPSIYEDKLNVARAAVAQDPKRVAQVVKIWVSSDA